MAPNDTGNLEKVKAEVRSILISCPEKKTELNKFLKDFEATIGRPLPFNEFNFRTPVQFLSSLNDVVNVSDSASCGIQLSPVVTQLSGHISQLVDHQKKSRSSQPRYSQSRRYLPHSNRKSFVNYPAQSVVNYPAQSVVNYPAQSVVNYPGCSLVPVYPALGFPPAYMFDNNRLWPMSQGFYPSNGNSFAQLRNGNNNLNSCQALNAVNSNGRQPLSKTVVKVDLPPTNENENKCTNIPFWKEGTVSDKINFSSARIQSKNKDDDVKCFSKKNEDDFKENQSSGKYSLSRLSSNSVQNVNSEDQIDSNGENSDLVKLGNAISVFTNEEKLPFFEEKTVNVNGLSYSIKSKIWNLLDTYSNGISSTTFLNLYENFHLQPLNVKSCGYSSLKEMVVKNEDVFSFEKTKDSDDWMLYDARVKPRRRQSVDAVNKWIPHYVVDNLAALAKKYPEGIDANHVLDSYKSQFGTEINPEILGFSNLRAFLENCKSIHYEFAGGRGVIYPKTWASKCQSVENVLQESALPPPEEMMFFWKEYFKENECDPSFRFKPPVIPDKKCVQVKVSDVSSPALFWIQFLEDAIALNSLMFQMNSFYDGEDSNYSLPSHLVLPGLAVASLFMNKWHRAVVSRVLNDEIEVTYVDFGTTAGTRLEQLRKLDTRFTVDRVYCVKASFFGLIPFDGDEWSLESCSYLFNQWGDKIVFAEIHFIDYQEPSITVNLYDTSENNEINIAEMLINRKLAKLLVNPVSDSTASVLNEATVSKFQKFLPRWFSCSQSNDNDLNSCLKNVMVCTSSNCEPIDDKAVPCCKIHCIQEFFKAKPELVAVLWENACKLEEERILNHMLYQVKDALVEWGWWNSCVDSQSFCFGSTSSKHNTSGSFSSQNCLNETIQSVSRLSLNNCSKSEQTNGEPVMKSPASLMESKTNSVLRKGNPLLMTTPKPSTVGRRCNLNAHFFFGRADPPVNPRVIKYLNTRMNNSILTIMYFEEDFRLSLYQLFDLSPSVPKVLAKYRLSLAKRDFEFYVVVKTENPELYADLEDLGLVLQGEDPTLVLFQDASTILRIIDPLTDCDEMFKILAAEMVNNVDKLISPIP